MGSTALPIWHWRRRDPSPYHALQLERRTAVQNFEHILAAADGIIIRRGIRMLSGRMGWARLRRLVAPLRLLPASAAAGRAAAGRARIWDAGVKVLLQLSALATAA